MDRRWAIAYGLIGVAVLFSAVANLGGGSGYGGLSTLLVLASALPVRHLGWGAIPYLVLAYIAMLGLGAILAVIIALVP